ncbi:transglutaminase domain-containing protein [Paenibacillus gansuensis]|uniref:Transglutaminase domain-containing protein n=1 Tax=Paenibacillus gansuensis TaxID=306542 RepID=A0ABW5PJC0_9BACL
MTEQTGVFSLDTAAMERIERKFQEKRQLAKARERELFHVFDEPLTEEEEWALKLLYAYMPVNDLADYNGELFLSHVRTTLDIRRQMPWGQRVPDPLFLHFVLPYRVNTENIEDSRGILFRELAERTKGLPMASAILETNYWCHEKATYIGSDLRTVSPLTMLRTARGRCGEESTLAVAALRSIGIPARQVYTPRWAHCDDNHAWVEAWADGTWHYLGACEPEARLDQGWFSPPSRRAMLINTRILARYPGPEDITLADPWFTEINLLESYAPTRTVKVTVKDMHGKPVYGAYVEFQLYNMAEFYPIAIVPTNEQGEASLKTGCGDLLIRAVKDGCWGEQKAAADGGGELELVIDRREQPTASQDFDMAPPPEREGEPVEPLSEDALLRHQARLEEGTSIRTGYEASFLTEAGAEEVAKRAGLPADRVWDILRKARGNGREIAAFLEERAPAYGEWPLRLLERMNEKDLADTFRPALDDFLIGALALSDGMDEELFSAYVLCPRVRYEMLGAHRREFQEAFRREAELYRNEPAQLARWIESTFRIWEDLPYLKGRGTPLGTFNLKAGDPDSLRILFVAVCRSLGIPARLHPSEQKPQYWMDGAWKDARVAKGPAEPLSPSQPGMLRLLWDSAAPNEASQAAYAVNFTVARLEGGRYKTLDYPHGKSDVYDETFEVEQGSYRLTSGVRLPDGTVRARFVFFAVRAGELTEVPLTFRRLEMNLPVLGEMDRTGLLASWEGAEKPLGEWIGRCSALVSWLEPEREPSKHLLRELTELQASFTEQAVPVVLIVGDRQLTASFDPGSYPALPAGTRFARDATYALLPAFLSEPPASEAGFPHLMVLDEKGRIRYTASGYRLGAAKEALEVLMSLRQ